MAEFIQNIYSKTQIPFAFILILGAGVMAYKLPRRNYFVLRVITCCAAIFTYSYLTGRIHWNIEIFQNPFFSFFMIFSLCAGAIAVCFKCDIWSCLFCATAGYCIQHFSYHVSRLIIICTEFHRWANITLEFVLQIAACAAVFLFFARKYLPVGTNIAIGKQVQVIIALVVLAVSVFISHYGKMFAIRARSTEILQIILLYAVITSALGLFIEFSSFFAKKTKNELEVVKRMWSIEQEQYRQSKENIELINIKSHDLKHQLVALKNKLNEDEYEEITQAVGIYDSAIKTGNAAIDVVLTEKSLLCAKNKIRLTCLIDGQWFSSFPEHEIYSLFGNALDNAIESVLRLDEDRRSISIVAYCKDNKINLQIENYFDGTVKFMDGMPLTSKRGDSHGFGVKSMKMLTKKHGGSLSVDVNGDIFTLGIILPVSDN